MRISRDKLNKLAHTIADTLAEIPECDFLEDRNTIRQEARKALEKLLLEETKIDAAARQKIASQRKIILEGSQEWDILYRKYYNDEVKRLGLETGFVPVKPCSHSWKASQLKTFFLPHFVLQLGYRNRDVHAL